MNISEPFISVLLAFNWICTNWSRYLFYMCVFAEEGSSIEEHKQGSFDHIDDTMNRLSNRGKSKALRNC